MICLTYIRALIANMDPLLLTYQVGPEPLLYDISTSLQPISIRDQMFRGYMIINRALSEGLIKEWQQPPILVVGAGVAGAMTAMTAVWHRIPTLLVEARSPFIQQIRGHTRFICPTQYDWPAPHWGEGKYPWVGPDSPLDWNSGRASSVALAWISKLNFMLGRYPDLLTLIPAKFKSHRVIPESKTVEAFFEPPLAVEPLICSIIISCAGFGSERHFIPDPDPQYTGYAFWDEDEFEQSDMGIKGKKPNVIVSGGGDGALQDFIRITTRTSSARQIYTQIFDEPVHDIERMIHIAEDYAQRSYVWSTTGDLDHPIQQKLHDDYVVAINRIFSDSRLRRKVEGALEDIIGKLHKRLTIKLAYPCEHFSTCYPLNRFLVLLIAEYIRRTFGYDPLQPRTKILEVYGVNGHYCLNTAYLCHGEDHEVIYAEALCSTLNTAGEQENSRVKLDGNPFNVVIIRHGIKAPSPPLGSLPTAAPPRQLIPYYIPW
jgi:hypothetical protein